MKNKHILIGVSFIIALMALTISVTLAQGPGTQDEVSIRTAPGTAFTYQGRLVRNNAPVSDTCDFRFTLWDAQNGGSQVGSTLDKSGVSVSDGYFTVQPDFGSGAFTGDARWLRIEVKCTGETDYTDLGRQPITPAPYALALPGLWTRQNDTSPNIIGGYGGNSVTAGVVGATIGGGGANGHTNRVTDNYGTVGGGRGNTASGPAATVSGGYYNTASGYAATVGGGQSNTASGLESTVGGGVSNEASGAGATVGGGRGNTASGLDATVGGGYYNTASGLDATVGGGVRNEASGAGATVGGGGYDGTNTDGNQALAGASTIGGGLGNVITTTASYATIGGGWSNTAFGPRSTIAGGEQNTASGYLATIGGGFDNRVTGDRSVVAGGVSNTASGTWATIPGGSGNVARGNYSFAAGHRAKANNQGCFVWGDSTNDEVFCTANNRTIFRSSGGFYIYTRSDLSSGVYLAASGNAWNALSDRERKENFQPVDPQAILDGVAQLPITTWNYKAQDDSIRHIGPMAQDFNALLPDLGGEGEEYINSLDADGVALAAIQGLYQQNRALAAENTELRAQVDDLTTRVEALEQDRTATGNRTLLPAAGLLLLAGVWVVQRRGGQP